MHRSIAFTAFLALSWSNVAGLRCDMGATGHTAMAGSAHTSAHPPTPPRPVPSHAHDRAHTAETPSAPPPHQPRRPSRLPHDHGLQHRCAPPRPPARHDPHPHRSRPGGLPHPAHPRRCRPGSRDTASPPHGVTRRAPPGAHTTPEGHSGRPDGRASGVTAPMAREPCQSCESWRSRRRSPFRHT